jgi:hypothetical protein
VTAYYKFLRRDLDGRCVGPFTGFVWPLPAPGAAGDWVGSPTAPSVCRQGVNACRLSDLPYWINDVLWRVELDADVVEADVKVAAAGARLLASIAAWDAEAQEAFAESCATRALELALDALAVVGADDKAARPRRSPRKDLPALAREIAAGPALGREREAANVVSLVADAAESAAGGEGATAAYVSARAAQYAGPRFDPDRPSAGDAYLRERSRQAQWFADNLGLAD